MPRLNRRAALPALARLGVPEAAAQAAPKGADNTIVLAGATVTVTTELGKEDVIRVEQDADSIDLRVRGSSFPAEHVTGGCVQENAVDPAGFRRVVCPSSVTDVVVTTQDGVDHIQGVTSRFLNSWKKRDGRFRVTMLSILNPAPGATVTILRRGGKRRGCRSPSARSRCRPTAASSGWSGRCARPASSRAPCARCEKLRRDGIGRVATYTFRRRLDFPVEKKQCMDPTNPKPRKC